MKRWFGYVKPYKKYFILGPLCMIVEVLGEVLLPRLYADIINHGIAGASIGRIIAVCAMMVLCSVIMMLGGIGGAYFGAKASVNFAADVRRDVFGKVQKFSFANIDRFSAGSLVTRLTNDVTQIMNFVNMLLRMFLRTPGMLIGALFSSLVSLLKFTADPLEKLPQIVYWLMGSLSGSSFEELAKILPFYIVCMAAVFLLRWRTNVLSLGDQEAKSFGLNVRRDRAIVIGTSSMLTALVVSISGIIGWVGIVVPHLARMLVGPDFRRLIPTSVSIGICYLLVVDDLCRTLTASEIPLGVITGIIGGIIFIAVMSGSKTKK